MDFLNQQKLSVHHFPPPNPEKAAQKFHGQGVASAAQYLMAGSRREQHAPLGGGIATRTGVTEITRSKGTEKMVACVRVKLPSIGAALVSSFVSGPKRSMTTFPE